MRTWITRHGDDGDGADEDGMHDGVDHNMDEDGTIKHGKRHQREEHGGHEGIDLSEQGSWEGRREHEGPGELSVLACVGINLTHHQFINVAKIISS